MVTSLSCTSACQQSTGEGTPAEELSSWLEMVGRSWLALDPAVCLLERQSWGWGGAQGSWRNHWKESRPAGRGTTIWGPSAGGTGVRRGALSVVHGIADKSGQTEVTPLSEGSPHRAPCQGGRALGGPCVCTWVVHRWSRDTCHKPGLNLQPRCALLQGKGLPSGLSVSPWAHLT